MGYRARFGGWLEGPYRQVGVMDTPNGSVASPGANRRNGDPLFLHPVSTTEKGFR